MVEKFKGFVKTEIYNQLQYYDVVDYLAGPDYQDALSKFILTPYEDDYEYVKRQVCYFISSWDYPIYVNMNPKSHMIIVDIKEKRS